MTYALIASLIANALVVLLFLRAQREERRSNRSDIGAIHARHEQERIAWGKERQILLNRIQAPEVAVGQTVSAPEPEERTFTFFDDDDDLRRELERLGGQMEKAIEEQDGGR